MRQTLPLFLLLTVLAQAPARCGEFSARLLFFNDSVYLSQDLRKPLEQLLSDPSSGLVLERVEERTAFYKKGSFAWPPPSGAQARQMRQLEQYVKRRGKTYAIETNWSTLVQHPMVSRGLNEKLLAMANEVSAPYGAESQAAELALDAAVLPWPDGETSELFLKPGDPPPGEWLRTTAANYYVVAGGSRTVITVFGKPRGGYGAQYDSLRKRQSEFYQPTAIINFSSLADYAENGFISTETVRSYWNDLGVALVAPSGRDLNTIFSMPPQAEGPAVVCSNAEPADLKAGPSPVKKYAVLEIDGARIGFLALADDPSVYYQDQLPFKMLPADRAANEAVRELLEKEQADFIVALSRLDKDDTDAVLAAAPNIDLVVSADSMARFSSKTVKMGLNSWRRDKHNYPVYSAQLRVGRIAELLLEFNQFGERKEPVVVEERNTDGYAQEDRFDSDYYQATNSYLASFFSSDNPALPEPRLVWPSARPARYYYQPLEIYTLSANALRRASGAEISALRILPLSGGGTGAVALPRLQYWLRSQNDIVLAQLKGSAVRKLLESADFGALPSSKSEDYENVLRYAVSGVNRKGEIYGTAVRDSEVYSVALPKELYRRLGGQQQDVRRSMSLAEAVSAELLRQSKESGCLPERLFSSYAASRSSGSAAAPELPAAVKRELDLLPDEAEAESLWQSMQARAQERLGRAVHALAEDRAVSKTVWRMNLRELSFSFARTQVDNAQLYSAFSDARVRADSQMTVKGVLRLFAESYTPDFRNDFGIVAEYGKLRISPAAAPAVESETSDRLQFVDDYMYRWRKLDGTFGGVTLGPFVGLAYDTEFTPQSGTPFRKIVRGKGGMKLFDGPWLRSLYAAAVTEQDFTYSPASTKYAWETGFDVLVPLKGNTNFAALGSYRNFFSGGNVRPTDYQYELELTGRINAEFIGSLKVGPFVQYYKAKGKLVSEPAENLLFGVGLNYAFLSKPLF